MSSCNAPGKYRTQLSYHSCFLALPTSFPVLAMKHYTAALLLHFILNHGPVLAEVPTFSAREGKTYIGSTVRCSPYYPMSRELTSSC